MSNTKGTTAINSPQGGGALSGLGEKFSPDLFTGTGNFSVPIAVPPGRNGFQPELTIGYSTGSGNGIFGSGWSLGIPGVTRKTSKGIPVYDDKSDIFILSGSEDLVPVKIESETVGGITSEKTYYRPRTEGLFARIIRHKKSNGEHYWEVRSKDGLISYYGTPGANNNDSRVLANPEKRDSIFAWCLHKTVDPFGNEIVYTYNRELVSSGNRTYDQLYISQIDYTKYPVPGTTPVEYKYLCQVKFFYESRPDAFSAYRQGFEVRTTKRCSHIELWTDAQAPVKTKTYHFEYNNDSLNGISLLKSVSVEGHNGSESEFMPPLEFKYSNFNPQKRDLRPIEGQLPSVSLAEPGFELVDLDGNGLPDILQLNGVSRRWPNLGNGKFGSPLSLDIAPSIQLGMPGVQLIDADGDGKSDLLVNDGVKAGYFPGRFRTVWDNKSFRPYPQIPSFSFEDPEVKLIDLDGDGVTDVLRNGSTFECFFNDPEKGFYKTRFTNKTFADFSFADPRMRFADMTGDGLQDIVFISSGKVQYWPNLGYGRFGDKITMRNAPRFPEEYNPAQILLGDLDGDGMTDIAFVEDNRVTLYVNQSGNSFSDPTIITGTPRIQSLNAIRITDILGIGQAGILWSYGAGEYTAGQMFFLDFTGGNKSYLLEEMNNNMGCLTRVSYGSSVYHYLRDEVKPETRWQTDLPFPVVVVNKVETLDLLSGGKMVTEYLYHHGYWDGSEREFRGFARVDVRDTETFERYNTGGLFAENFSQVSIEHYTPPTETRNWFYPGPVGDGYGKWFEPDFSHEYWQGDIPIFERSQAVKDLLAHLPRRAERDALRTLRGAPLRSELYALDGSSLQNKPYTVTECMMEVRLEFDPSLLPQPLWAESQGGYSAGGGYIFFPFGIGQRSTHWERGNEPMHSLSFSSGYDNYGQATKQINIGVPQGCNLLFGGQGEYLATYKISDYIYTDLLHGQYMVDRVKRSVSYDATHNSIGTSVFDLRDNIFNGTLILPAIGCDLIFYDGNAFDGLSYGEIGEYGVPVRTESLIITDEIINAAYGTETPESFKSIPDWSSANGYPAEFEGLLQNGDVRLGFKDRRVGFATHILGWYSEGNRIKYDFHENSTAYGLAIEMKDVFDNISTITYDDYGVFPIVNVTPLGLKSLAEYDYRVMKAYRITDINLNITEHDFSPLGLLRATASIGKGMEGDWRGNIGGFYERYAPSFLFEYDFLAFYTTNQNPAWVQTIKRERYITDLDDTGKVLISREYSDGFGRLLQARIQAEDIIFGNASGWEFFGNSGLSADQTAPNSAAVGVERNSDDELNVIVSGWCIYNNKGNVVEKHESFYSRGLDYTAPYGLGAKVKTYYNPMGKIIRTLNPDNTEQRVIYGTPLDIRNIDAFIPTPWENYVYDSNDLAPITHPTGNIVPPEHFFTPKSVLVDSLGRDIKTTEHVNNIHISHPDNITMQYKYDIRGNLIQITDPLEREVFKYIYDFRKPKEENGKKQPVPRLKNIHLDSGHSSIIYDVSGQAIESNDIKSAKALFAYDELSRPIRTWSRNNALDTLRLISYTIYGEDFGSSPEVYNLYGTAWKVYDESGMVESAEYDFKGNLLKKKQYVISTSTLQNSLDNYQTFLVDWSGLPSILDSNFFETDRTYDAIGRAVKTVLPQNMDGNRCEIIPVYNRAGLMERVMYDGVEYVKHIAYNAKGQRILIAMGNDVMVRYAYDDKNFRLLRQRSEKYTFSQLGNICTYNYDSGNKRQDDGFNFDFQGNIIKIMYRLSDCGIHDEPLGSDKLDRVFEYDPIYRLISATGRESDTQSGDSYLYGDAPKLSASSNANNVRAYKQSYSYDKVGNVQQVKQTLGNNFTRKFVYNSGQNTLQRINTASDSLIEDYIYDSVGNQLSAGTTRNYIWNASNKLIAYYNQASGADPTVYAQYDYNTGGNRVSKLVRTGTSANPIYERTIYIDGIFEYHIYEGSSTIEKTYAHIIDNKSRIASVRTGTPFPDDVDDKVYQIEDQINSCTLRLSVSGSIIDREEYYPFGDSSLRTFEKKSYRYVGKEKDAESGLYYYGARYYSPWTCRFISVDPLANKYVHISPYNYADNDPINNYDIDGMQTPKTSNTGDKSFDALVDKATARAEKYGYDLQIHSFKVGDNFYGSVTLIHKKGSVTQKYTNIGGDKTLYQPVFKPTAQPSQSVDGATNFQIKESPVAEPKKTERKDFVSAAVDKIGPDDAKSVLEIGTESVLKVVDPEVLYKEGYRAGAGGPGSVYQLTGRNLKLFGPMPMSNNTIPINKVNFFASKYVAPTLSHAGTALTVYGVADDSRQFFTREIGEGRYMYRLAGHGTGIYIGLACGGPLGAVLGLLASILFRLGELAYDYYLKPKIIDPYIKPPIENWFGNMFNQLESYRIYNGGY